MGTDGIFRKLIVILGVRLEGVQERQTQEKDVYRLLETGDYEALPKLFNPEIEVFRSNASKDEVQTHIIIGDKNTVTSIRNYYSQPSSTTGSL
jgi:hypothetical protein